MSNTETLLLIDGSSYFYRAFHALPPLSNSKGMPTGAVYGVVNMIRATVKEYQPTYVACVFDSKGKTFRDDLYPEYKATREAMPNDLVVQFKPMMDILTGLGFPIIIHPGVEADDVIGTLAKTAERHNIATVISTGDKDMAQLVNQHITLINTMSKTKMDSAGVVAKFGVPPELIIDYLTLIGDKVDNVPGVDKVGPKTAVKWLEQYGSLDNIMAKADEFPGKVGEHLRTALNHLPLSKKLVTIECQLTDMPDVHTLKMGEIDNPALIELYRELEFKTWLSDALGTSGTQEAEPKAKKERDYQIILSESKLHNWFQRLKAAPLFALHVVTNDMDYMKAEIVGLSFAIEPEQAAYLPLGHGDLLGPVQLNLEKTLNMLKPLLEDANKIKVGQNLKYDKNVLAHYGIDLQGIQFDTMLESYVLNSNATRHDLNALSLKYLGKNTISYEDIAGKGVKQLAAHHIEIETMAAYAAEHADITLQLHLNLWPKISKIPGLKNTFEKIELPLLSVLSRMECTGVLIDAAHLRQQSVELAKRIDQLEQQAYALAGEAFNLSSPKQLQSILFEKMGIPVVQKTPTGQPSTAENVLQELAYDYELPAIILEYRSLAKLKSTYTDTLPLQIQPQTGRVHTSYNQAIAATGRLSSTDPNLQNIPIRHEEGRRIRQAFIASKGMKIVSADYSQIELRIMAHLSGDPGLCHAFADRLDIHTATAAQVFGVPLDQVTSEQRRNSKAINFGLIYGMSSFGLSKQLGTSRDEAQQFIERYFARYPKVKQYMEDMRNKAHEQGFVETVFGRRLYLPEINARNLQRQRAAERAAINAPMQGTAADLIKLAMIDIDYYLQQSNWNARMIMQVHDELVFEVAEDQVDAIIPEIKHRMNHAVELSVPLEVEVGVGVNWDEAH